VAVLRHPVFLVKIGTQHARKGQPNEYRLATASLDKRALPRGQHVRQPRTQISCGRRLAQRKEGIAAQERLKAVKRFNGVLALAGRTSELMGKKGDPHCKALSIDKERGFFLHWLGGPPSL